VLPKQNTKILRANSSELSQALDRVSLFSGQPDASGQILDHEQQTQADRPDPGPGGGDGEIDVKYNADDLDIGYNANYLLDILRTIDSDEVEIRLNTPVTAGLVVPRPRTRPRARAAGRPPLPRDAAPTRRLIVLACGFCRSS